MSQSLIVNRITQAQLSQFIASPSHAVMLVGPAGSGKDTISGSLAESVLDLEPNTLANYPYKMLIEPQEHKSIGIEAIRELEHFLSLKVPGKRAFDRAVIVKSAHNLTLEAQNALLKTLEEPPQGTLIILNVVNGLSLLPTVRSRVQVIDVKRPDAQELEHYYEDTGFDKEKIAQAYAISGGLPGLMQSLLDNTDHPLLSATEQARKLLSGNTYDRLLLVDKLSKQRELSIDTLTILQQMARVSLMSAKGSAAKKWQAVLEAAFKASAQLQSSAQLKLVLMNLVLSMSS